MADALPVLMSQAAYARYIGASRQYVQKLVKAGVIRIRKDKKLNRKQADAARLAAEDPAHAHRRTTTPPEGEPEQQGSAHGTYQQGRALEKAYKAKLVQLQYEVEAGKLVDREQYGNAVYAMARATRNALRRIPDRVGAVLAADMDINSVKRRLLEEIDLALHQLADTELAKSLEGDSV